MNALAGDAPLRFAPFIARPGDVLSRPRRFGFLDRLGAIPIADTELLQLSQHLPLVLRDNGAGCEVLAVVHSGLVSDVPLRRNGRWIRSYLPMALRSLPLRRADRGLEITSDLDADEQASTVPVWDDEGRPHPDFTATVKLLDRLAIGKARLEKAARKLVAADLLVELRTRESGPGPLGANLLVVDRRRLQSLSSSRVAALAGDDFLALDLATACCFSQRLLSRHVMTTAMCGENEIAPRPSMDHVTQGVFFIDLRIDESALFSSETFHRADAERLGSDGADGRV